MAPPSRYDCDLLTFIWRVGVNLVTFQDIMAKRNQKPEVRKAQREQAVRAAKDAKKQTASKKAPAGDKKAQKSQKQAVKNVQKSAPRVGGKR